MTHIDDIPPMREILYSPTSLQYVKARRKRDGFPVTLDEIIGEQEPLTLTNAQRLDFVRAIVRLPKRQNK